MGYLFFVNFISFWLRSPFAVHEKILILSGFFRLLRGLDSNQEPSPYTFSITFVWSGLYLHLFFRIRCFGI